MTEEESMNLAISVANDIERYYSQSTYFQQSHKKALLAIILKFISSNCGNRIIQFQNDIEALKEALLEEPGANSNNEPL